MALLPVKATVPPSDVTGQQNGALNPALLTQIGTGLARLHHTAARGWFALKDAAFKAGGWTLHYTSVADTYRTYTVQLATFLDRYIPVSQTVYIATPAERRKMWQAAPSLGYSSIYWVKKNFGTVVKPVYKATAATPGTSPHGLGLAIDGCFPGPVAWTPALPWLTANARRFGFAWSLQSEPWHIQWVMGDVIPQAVLDFENPPLPPPDPDPEPEEDVLDRIIRPTFTGVPDWYPYLGLFDSGEVRQTVSHDMEPRVHFSATEKEFPVSDEGQYRRLCAQFNIQLVVPIP